jgi:hypothetical protein
MQNNEKTNEEFEPMLGMIIKIVAPNDSRFDNKYFLIDYLDDNLMKIIDDNYKTYNLTIENNEFNEKSISYILPVHTPLYLGYAKQNGLIPGTWWTIEYNPENANPQLYNGEITNLEEDQIEFKIQDTEDIMYIDFKYKGIPLDMPIKFYKAVDPMPKKNIVKDINNNLLVDSRFEQEDGWADMMEEDDEELREKDNVETEKKTLIMEADQIEFKILDENVTFDVEKQEEEKIYHITVQTDDLLQSILSNVPSNKRTPQKLQEISLIINRFVELRKEFSEFNEFENTETWKKYSEYKPIVNSLKKLNKNINWIIPIVKNQLSIFFNKTKEVNDDRDMIVKKNDTSFLEEARVKRKYHAKIYNNEEFNKYEFINNKSFKPSHSTPNDKSNILTQLEGKYSFRTNTDLLTISSNLNNNLESSIIDVNNDKLNIGTFNTHSYITGQYRLHPIKNDLHERYRFSNNDVVPMIGLLLLPRPYLKKSQETFISTSIYNKVNFHQTPLLYFNYLKPNKYIRKIKINTNSEYNNLLNLKNNMYYHYDQNNVNYDDRNKSEDLDMFLNKVIPDTKNIIQEEILNKNFQNCCSYERFLYKLQPYHIQHKNINKDHISVILPQLREEIEYIRSQQQKKINDINLYFKYLPNTRLTLSSLIDIIPEEKEKTPEQSEIDITDTKVEANTMVKSVKNAYDIVDTELPSEYLQKTINVDTSSYLYNCIVYSQLNVVNDINIENVIENLKTKLESSQNLLGDTQKPKSVCDLKSSSLSKRYKNIEELQNDENIVIYFDKEYDETRYDIYDELDHIKFIDDLRKRKKMLVNHLITEIDVPEEDASEQAISMIEGKKLVKDNDYAVLDSGFNLRYYKRNNNKWVLDEVYNDIPINEIQFCNLRTGCIKIEKKCQPIADVQKDTEIELMKEMLDKVENELRGNTEEMKEKIKHTLQNNLQNIILLTEYNRSKTIKYDKIRADIGNNFSMIEYERSPSLEIRDTVLNTKDIVLKYDRILKFSDKYCRYANIDEGEDSNWFYCSISSDQSFKLMPTFFYELANSFSTGNSSAYSQVLEKVKRDRGELSDDGDKIIDRYSGYEIAKIQSSTEEGYEASGKKMISRGALDTAFDDQLKIQEEVLKNEAKPEKIKMEEELDQYSINILKILPGIDNHLGINTSSQYKFISKNVLYLMEKKLEKEKNWIENNNKDFKDLSDKDKKKKYGKHKIDFYCKTLIGLYLVAIQTNIPHIKKGKGFTGCVEAFIGWPLGKGDDFITYVVCSLIVIRGSGKTDNIWQGLPKFKKDRKEKTETKYVEKLKKFMKKHIMKLDDVKDKLQNKISFLANNQETAYVQDNFDYKKWHTFLPPLVSFNLNKLTSPGAKIKSTIINSFQDNNVYKSQELLNNLYSQIQSYSLSIQEDIQRIIDTQPVEDLLLKSQTGDTIFLENACCNESNDSPYDYFVNKQKNKDIKDHNEKVYELSELQNNFNTLLKSALFNSLENTRAPVDQHSDMFSDNTIYQSFIHFCKFNTGIPLDEFLGSFCSTNKSGFTVLNTIEEKIEIMKSENHNYDHNSLVSLLEYVGKKSNPQMLQITPIESSKAIFEKVLEEYKESSFIQNIYEELHNLLDRFDVAYNEKTDVAVEDLNKKLNSEINKSHETIKEILSIKKDKRLLKAFDDIHKLKNLPAMDIKRGEEMYMSKEDENGFFLFDFLLSMSKNLSYIYPNRILQKVKSNENYLEYWKFEENHANKIKANTYKELLVLDSYNNNTREGVDRVLSIVINKTKDIIVFLEKIPFYAGMGNLKTIFDGETVQNLSYYLFICIIKEYFNAIEEMYANIDQESVLKRSRLKSKKEILIKNIIDLIYDYIDIISKYKKTISKSRFEILESANKFREKDRDAVTSKYKKMSDDEKKVEKLKSKHKLGDWSVGATKAIFQYDANFTASELQRLEQRTLDEYRLKKNDNITDDLIDALDLRGRIEEMNREIVVQREIDIENDVQNVFGEDEDDDDLEQYD